MAARTLIGLCKSNDILAVTERVQRGANISMNNKRGETPLLIACRYGYRTLTGILLSHGADSNFPDAMPIYEAVIHANTDIAKLLIEHGCDLDQPNVRENFSLLHVAATAGDESIGQMLIDRGFSLDARDDGERTPLHWAVQEGHYAFVKLLIESGASINVFDEHGFTPLHIAVGEGHDAIVDLLITAGADSNLQGTNQEVGTALHIACAYGHRHIAKMLIARGADINALDGEGRTPICFAAMYGYHELAEDLIVAGARLDIIDAEGESLLKIARENNSIEVANLLKWYAAPGGSLG